MRINSFPSYSEWILLQGVISVWFLYPVLPLHQVYKRRFEEDFPIPKRTAFALVMSVAKLTIAYPLKEKICCEIVKCPALFDVIEIGFFLFVVPRFLRVAQKEKSN
ncbi:hypothetical protein CEXT_501391 [Caerostris extrusa]|uniref:Uncharacterized protein n=1 Tax=Caerostris extrusa TaxID=172846 RepID=A0AAV4S6T8_CAEEX|nr:hypothetical protein CEXT_501391 [Caerostris extrusa]